MPAMERTRGDARERDGDGNEARSRRFAHVQLVPDDERDAREADRHARPLACREPLAQGLEPAAGHIPTG